jgi:hypothetical protein
MDLRGGSSVAEAEAPVAEVCDEAKKASSDAEKYVQEQLEFWNSLTPEQVRGDKLRWFNSFLCSLFLSL